MIDLVLIAYFRFIASGFRSLTLAGLPRPVCSAFFYIFLPAMLLTVCARAYRRNTLGHGGE